METLADLLLPSFIFVILFGLILLGILTYVVKVKRPYIKKATLMTPTEMKFFNILKLANEDKYDIFAQVRLANIIDVKQGSLYFWKHFSPIGMKSLDFALTDKNSSKVVLIIELDDYTHNLKHRIARDKFVDESLKIVNIPILHQKVQDWYNIKDLKVTIQGLALK